jgi:hypothetical protein
VIGRLDLQRDVVDAEPVAQHRAQVVQHVLSAPAVRSHVSAHRIEAAGD